MTIPDHFLWIDRAAVITAWLGPIAWIVGGVAVIMVCVTVLCLGKDKP